MNAMTLAMVAAVALGAAREQARELPRERTEGRLEVVARLSGAMPTGVAVSRSGRVFVNFPKWGDPVEYTVAELKGGKPVPYPNAELNRAGGENVAEVLVSVQSVVVDPADRLWILDTGSIQFGPPRPGGPKLLGVDLASDRVVKKITFPPDVVLPTTYLNDVRFDLRRGKEGFAFITDSSPRGPNALIVVDLATGKSWRRLEGHASTKASQDFLPIVEGAVLLNRPAEGPPSRMTVGADGIAISPDGKRLFYCPLSSRRLYSVSVDALSDPATTEEKVAETVEDLGEKGASDGLESDAQGRVYVTDYEHNAIRRRTADGQYELLVHDPRVLWPDTLALAAGGYLYFTANQLHRQPGFHRGLDLRAKPYVVFRLKVDASPIPAPK